MAEGSPEYELTPSPPCKGGGGRGDDDPGYVPPANIKSKRGRKRKKKEVHVDSDYSGDDDGGGNNTIFNSRLMEYQWPLYGNDKSWYMLQEQVGEYLDIRGMQRRYPDLERRAVDVVEKKYLIETEIVTETQGNMGLVALKSDEVLQLMEDEFPLKHKEYLEIVAEIQAQMAIERNIHDHQMMANSEVTQERSNPSEILDTMTKETVNCNRLYAKIREANQKVQGTGPRRSMSSCPVKKKVINRYPVALIPGQYCDTVQRFTEDELRKLPLLTADPFHH